MKGIRKALSEIKKGHKVYYNVLTNTLQLKPGAWKAEVREITPSAAEAEEPCVVRVDGTTQKALQAACKAAKQAYENEIERVSDVIDAAVRCKNSYWWQPATKASDRRERERYYTRHAEWKEGGHTWTADTDMSQSCRYVYFNTYYFKDGKKTNLTAVKNSYRRLCAERGMEDDD